MQASEVCPCHGEPWYVRSGGERAGGRECRIKRLERKRRWKEQNLEKYREANRLRQRRYREENREKVRESYRRYYEENREKMRERDRKRNALRYFDPEYRKQHTIYMLFYRQRKKVEKYGRDGLIDQRLSRGDDGQEADSRRDRAA